MPSPTEVSIASVRRFMRRRSAVCSATRRSRLSRRAWMSATSSTCRTPTARTSSTHRAVSVWVSGPWANTVWTPAARSSSEKTSKRGLDVETGAGRRSRGAPARGRRVPGRGGQHEVGRDPHQVLRGADHVGAAGVLHREHQVGHGAEHETEADHRVEGAVALVAHDEEERDRQHGDVEEGEHQDAGVIGDVLRGHEPGEHQHQRDDQDRAAGDHAVEPAHHQACLARRGVGEHEQAEDRHHQRQAHQDVADEPRG